MFTKHYVLLANYKFLCLQFQQANKSKVQDHA